MVARTSALEPLVTDHQSLLAANQCFLAGPDRTLVQCSAMQTPDTQSLSGHRRVGANDYVVYKVRKSFTQTDPLDLHRSETRNQTRNDLTKRCTKPPKDPISDARHQLVLDKIASSISMLSVSRLEANIPNKN